MTKILHNWWRDWTYGLRFGLPLLLWPAIVIGGSGVFLQLSPEAFPAKYHLVNALLGFGFCCGLAESIRLCHSIWIDPER